MPPIKRHLPFAGGAVQCKAPEHLIIIEAYEGHLKELSLFLSLKRIYENSILWNWEKIPLDKIGYRISRPTYKKYVYNLIRRGFIHAYNKHIRLVGQREMLEMFPLNEGQKLKFAYLDNDKHLRHNLEKIVIDRNLKAQAAKYKSESKGTTCKAQKIIKKVTDSWKEYLCDPNADTNLSRITIARKLGFSHYITGWRRMKKWKQEGFCRSIQRYERLDVAPAMLEDRRYLKTKTGYLKRLSNEIEIRLTKFGQKVKQFIPCSVEERVVSMYCNDCFD